ncbi:KDM5 [Acanthosepion pharaonis]|uniref:[histone H3]-trimethyl-L-lysine(4) demethylase n=1 Tax=Acanthosepion pharaonis TaxID=158019 RepID=A0A812ASP0_ACAPH|nr:KDM5 [Sepia pharaonis]
MALLDTPYNNFVSPPDAPVFTPTVEEFTDPLGYIAKIKSIAEKTGICKIKPPPDWQPPFAVNVDKFTFVPRIQKLNELEAKSRIKLNFLDQLARFWELQGCSLRIPHVERKLLDLFVLYKIVDEIGGYDNVVKEKKWAQVATKLGLPTGKGLGSIVKAHYDRILYPFWLFKNDQPYSHKVPTPTQNSKIDYSANNELRKLQFYGAGPKAAVPGTVKDEKIDVKHIKKEVKGRAKEEYTHLNYDDAKTGLPLNFKVDAYVCQVCDKGDGEEFMLLCDGCDDAFHTYCLTPPMPEVPKGDWRCPECVKEACKPVIDCYGFEQSPKEYTLQSFGEMADQFKSDHFNMPVHMVSFDQVEKEFWRLVNTLEEEVTVQYGADIHAMEKGSGFPTKSNKDTFPEDEEYINSGWNLNNLPILEKSVLCHINADISGMKIPWCYVGMCFSCFCWHNEDHWSYSINYMHWGEPKTWYGVPGEAAEFFEDSMKKSAPELFEQSPDLLHQLTTIMNPNILMDMGVPVVKTHQCAGEFVVTFPRAYHAGFNQGYNFAEAVNFCPADWLPIGRVCIDYYRKLQRQCVFSHEELICKMAADPDSLDFNLAAATHKDMLVMVENEKKLRKRLLDRGTTDAEREAFELLPDDERQCDYCKTTCFLSAVTCPCRPNTVMCIHHVEYLCGCHPSHHCLRYRYTLDELPAMLHRIKVRAECFDNWRTQAKRALEPTADKVDLEELHKLISEAEDKHFPDSELLDRLTNAVNEAEKCALVANQLVSKKVRTRNRQAGDAKYVAKLSLEELKCFYEQVNNLPCIIPEAKLVKELLDKVTDFQNEAQAALNEETPDSEKLEKFMDYGITLDVDLPEIPKLKQVLHQARWLDEVKYTTQDSHNLTLEVMRKLIESGVGLAPHPAVEKAMAELQELLTISERWEEKARLCLQARPRNVMATLESIILEASDIKAYLPNVCALKEALRKAKEWISKLECVQEECRTKNKEQNCELYPYLDVLENLVNKGRPIPVRLDLLPQVESQVAAAKSWRERTARTFLKKNSTYTLLEVLSPRTDIGIYNNNKSKKKKLKEGERERKESESSNSNILDFRIEEQRDPASIVAAFKLAEQREIEAMKELRTRNVEKTRHPDADVKYCICRKGASAVMLQCELCKDWFHGSCVPLPKSANVKKISPGVQMQTSRDLKFLCPLCLRSRRPRLETILSLLVSLQKLPVRLPEGEALQCLTERAMAWQDRARNALATPELASALAKLSLLNQRMVEQAAREKTEKIISAELMKAANNPELQGHLASVTQSAFSGVQSSQKDFNTFAVDTDSSQSMQLSPGSPHSMEEPLLGSSTDLLLNGHNNNNNNNNINGNNNSSNSNNGGMSSEHAYSSASKSTFAVSPRKHQRKSPLIPRQLESPVLELSAAARLQLEELMMEGDLLEVSLDETQHIKRIIMAYQTSGEDKYMEFEESSERIFFKEKSEKNRSKNKEKDKEKVKKKRKKKSDEADNPDGKVKKNKEEPNIIKTKKKLILKDKEMKFKEKGKSKDSTNSNDTKGKKEDKSLKRSQKPSGAGRNGDKKNSLKEKRKSKGNSSSGDDEGDDDDCSAVKCLKPTGDEVNWVQCDRCELWFHLLCVGVGEDEVGEDDDYLIAWKWSPSLHPFYSLFFSLTSPLPLPSIPNFPFHTSPPLPHVKTATTPTPFSFFSHHGQGRSFLRLSFSFFTFSSITSFFSLSNFWEGLPPE